MEAISSLLNSPIEALSNAAAAAVGAPTAANGTAAAGMQVAQGNATFTEDTLRMVLYNLFHGDSRLQQQTLQQYYSPDVVFRLNEGFLELTGVDSLQQFLRGCQLLASFKPEVVEISTTADTAVVLLNLNIAYKLLPLTWWRRIPVATTVTLHFGRPSQPAASSAPAAVAAAAAAALAPSGDLVTHHVQDLSFLDAIWWNPAWDWINAKLWGRISGRVLSLLVQFEEPLLSKHASYISGGAGLVQSLLWSLEDLLHSLGLQKGVTALSPNQKKQQILAEYQQQQQQQQRQLPSAAQQQPAESEAAWQHVGDAPDNTGSSGPVAAVLLPAVQ